MIELKSIRLELFLACHLFQFSFEKEARLRYSKKYPSSTFNDENEQIDVVTWKNGGAHSVH